MGVTRVRHRKTSYRPLADSICKNGSSIHILYVCPKCRADFRILGEQERFCHNCGKKIDWTGCPDEIVPLVWNAICKFYKDDEVLAELKYLEFINKVF